MKTKALIAVPVAVLALWVVRHGAVSPQNPEGPRPEPASRQQAPAPPLSRLWTTRASAQPQPSRAAELVEQISELRRLDFWQPRGWANRLAFETALRELKDLGYGSAAELPAGVLEDPLDFLPSDRREVVEPSVSVIQTQIRDLDYRLLGEAWEGSDVDWLKELQTQEYQMLSQKLTKDELKTWAAQHTYEGQRLRELPVQLSREHFTETAYANFEFERQAEALDLTTEEDLARVAEIKAARDATVRQALGSQEALDQLERATMPGYAAVMERATVLGVNPESADYLWQLSHWADQVEPALVDRSTAEQTAIMQAARQLGRNLMTQTLGEEAAKNWLESPEGLLFQEPPPELLAPSIAPAPAE